MSRTVSNHSSSAQLSYIIYRYSHRWAIYVKVFQNSIKELGSCTVLPESILLCHQSFWIQAPVWANSLFHCSITWQHSFLFSICHTEDIKLSLLLHFCVKSTVSHVTSLEMWIICGKGFNWVENMNILCVLAKLMW